MKKIVALLVLAAMLLTAVAASAEPVSIAIVYSSTVDDNYNNNGFIYDFGDKLADDVKAALAKLQGEANLVDYTSIVLD